MFDFVPKAVVIHGYASGGASTNGGYYSIVMLNGQTHIEANPNKGDYSYNLDLTISWSGNSVRWYRSDGDYAYSNQYNTQGKTYNYLALG